MAAVESLRVNTRDHVREAIRPVQQVNILAQMLLDARHAQLEPTRAQALVVVLPVRLAITRLLV